MRGPDPVSRNALARSQGRPSPADDFGPCPGRRIVPSAVRARAPTTAPSSRVRQDPAGGRSDDAGRGVRGPASTIIIIIIRTSAAGHPLASRTDGRPPRRGDSRRRVLRSKRDFTATDRLRAEAISLSPNARSVYCGRCRPLRSPSTRGAAFMFAPAHVPRYGTGAPRAFGSHRGYPFNACSTAAFKSS